MNTKTELDRDVERYRLADQTIQSSARWLAGAFGAIAAVLLAGLSLSELGHLPLWRLATAVAGVGVGLTTTAMVIYQTAGVWVTGFLSFGQLEATLAATAPHVVRDDGTVVVGGTADELGEAVQSEFSRYGTETSRNYPTPSLLRGYLGHLERTVSNTPRQSVEWHELRAEQAAAEKAANQMLAYANSYLIGRNYRALRQTTKWAGAVFALGAGLFAWAASPAEPPPPDPVVVQVETPDADDLAKIEQELQQLKTAIAELQDTVTTSRP